MTLSRCLLSCGELDWLLDFVPGGVHAFLELDRRFPLRPRHASTASLTIHHNELGGRGRLCDSEHNSDDWRQCGSHVCQHPCRNRSNHLRALRPLVGTNPNMNGPLVNR